jgi:hypothetical protein
MPNHPILQKLFTDTVEDELDRSASPVLLARGLDIQNSRGVYSIVMEVS